MLVIAEFPIRFDQKVSGTQTLTPIRLPSVNEPPRLQANGKHEGHPLGHHRQRGEGDGLHGHSQLDLEGIPLHEVDRG